MNTFHRISHGAINFGLLKGIEASFSRAQSDTIAFIYEACHSDLMQIFPLPGTQPVGVIRCINNRKQIAKRESSRYCYST